MNKLTSAFNTTLSQISKLTVATRHGPPPDEGGDDDNKATDSAWGRNCKDLAVACHSKAGVIGHELWLGSRSRTWRSNGAA
jgi:hypothetical protein